MLQSTKLAWLVVGMLVVSGTASALEDVAVDASLDYMGKYIWRGQAFTDDPVLQPAVNVGVDKLTLGIWGNMELTNVNGERHEFTEVDYTVDYTDALPGVDGASYSVGAIHYHFPRAMAGADATTEIYAGIGLDTMLSPTATLYYDVDEIGGFYASFGVSHAIDISEYGLLEDMINSVELAGSLGYADRNYNNDYWGESVDALNDLVISATIPVELCSNSTLNASCSYVSLLDGSIKGNATSQKSSYLYAGIGLACSF